MVRKNNGYTGLMMEKKDKKKLVIIFVMILFVGICVDLSKGITDIENVLVRNELGESNRQEQLVVTIEGVQKELECTEVTPEEHVVKQETAEYIQQLLDDLKDEYRIVIVLRELEGYSYDEIADLLSCSLGTVKSRISRARQYLKERIMSDKIMERSGTDDRT